MTSSADAATAASRIATVLPPTRWLVMLLLPLAVLKGLQVFAAAPTADEAYYWLWGQHLSLSYYDHPPLAAWLQGLSHEIFGWNLFALRAMTVFSFAGCLWILWFWSRRLAGEESPLRVFLGGAIALLSVPMLLRYQSVAHQDHLLVLFGLLTAHFWALFVEGLDEGDRRWRFFYAGCVALGLAGLSKYNAVFIGLGFAAWVLLSAKGRVLLATPQLWFGAAIAVALQAPVLVWNVTHDWPSFRYNLENRIGQQMHGGFAGNLTAFLINSAVMVSPSLWIAAGRFLGPRRTPFQPVGRAVLLVSTLAFVALCASNTVLYYWNLTAFLFVLPVIVFHLGSRFEFTMMAIYGIFVSAWVIGFQVIYPSYKANGHDERDNDISFGIAEIAAIVAEEEKRLEPDMVATTDYRTAALLSFASRRLDIANIGPRASQFDFWFDPAEHRGARALVLVDDFISEDRGVTQAFEKVTPVRSFTITRFGFPMHSYRLVLAEGYSGELRR